MCIPGELTRYRYFVERMRRDGSAGRRSIIAPIICISVNQETQTKFVFDAQDRQFRTADIPGELEPVLS